jgi:hypothetical protein
MVEEGKAVDSFTAAAESESMIRPSARATTIKVDSGEVGLGQTKTLPIWVHVPEANNLTAITLDITFDSSIVTFVGCQTNESAFSLSLCALQEGQEEGGESYQKTVSITALALNGVRGDLLLAEVEFTGHTSGITQLTLNSRAFEDGSGNGPHLRHGRLQVHPNSEIIESE